ncbi:hypothetical protein BRADI_1g12314v3, partial [Brachypodium distachyon]
MIVFAWNCRGLGQSRTVQELVRLVRTHCPNIVFLSETRQNKSYVESICRRLGFQNCLPFSIKGKGGGLALYWNND